MALTNLLLQSLIDRSKHILLLLVLCLSLSSGAEVDHEGQNKRTPLHEASDAGHPTITELLIKQGADPIPRDDSDSTPYDLAFHKGHTKVCLSLLAYHFPYRRGCQFREWLECSVYATRHSSIYLVRLLRFSASCLQFEICSCMSQSSVFHMSCGFQGQSFTKYSVCEANSKCSLVWMVPL